MSKIQDQVKQAQSLLNPDGSRKYSDQQIYDRVLATESGKKALDTVGEGDLRTYLGLEAQTPQDTSWARYPKMVGGGLVSGAASVLDMPSAAFHLINNLVPDDWKQNPNSPLLNIPSARQAVKSLGIADREDVQPQNFGEKLVQGASEGIGASLPLLPFGGLEAIPAFFGAGIGSGVGETTMDELFPDNPLMGLFGSVAGAIGGQGVVRTVEEAAARSAAATRIDQLSQQLRGFDLNFNDQNLAKQAARDAILAQADKGLREGKTLAAAAADAARAGPHGEIQAAAASLAPTAMNWQDAGEALQGAAQKWMEALPEKLKTAWEPIDKGIPGNRQMDLDNFEKTLSQLVPTGNAGQGLLDLLTPALPRQLSSRLAAIKGAQDMGAVGAFTWNDARALRSAIGENLANPGLIPGIGQQQLKALYKSLTQDLQGVAKAEGLGSEFDAANAASSQLFATAEGPIGKVLGSRLPGEIAKSLYGQGATDASLLTALRAELPEGLDALGAAGLREGQWNKLSPAAREALVPDVKTRAKVDQAFLDLGAADSMHRVATDAAGAVAAQTKNEANAAYAGWKQAKRTEKLRLASDLAEARAVGEKVGLTSGASDTANSLKNLVRMAGGGVGGGLLIDALGVNPDAWMNSKIAAGISLGVPFALHLGNELFKHPDLAAGPLIGVSAGNTLQEREDRGLP